MFLGFLATVDKVKPPARTPAKPTDPHTRNQNSRHTLLHPDLMPWNDPHTAAPSLRAWQDAEGFAYECSATPLDASTNGRRGMESFLLYRYRQEYGASTLCNFGRFHLRYRKSTNRKENLRGGKLEVGQKDNPAGGPSHPPLHPRGKPGEPSWMGLSWSDRETLVPDKTRNASSGPGLYILIDSGSQEIIYIGQSRNCANRLLSHSRNLWDGKDLELSTNGRRKEGKKASSLFQVGKSNWIFPHPLKPPCPGATRRGVAPTPVEGVGLLIMQGFGGGSPRYTV